jgi:hypothetical protein
MVWMGGYQRVLKCSKMLTFSTSSCDSMSEKKQAFAIKLRCSGTRWREGIRSSRGLRGKLHPCYPDLSLLNGNSAVGWSMG